MVKSKRLLCIILAVAVMFGTLGVMTAFADNTSEEKTLATNAYLDSSEELSGSPKYLFDFDTSLDTNFLTCTEMSALLGQDPFENGSAYADDSFPGQDLSGVSKSYNSNKSLTLSKDKTQLGANLEIKVTDEMRANYLKATDKKFYASFYLSNCKNPAKDKFADAMIRVYVRFKNAYRKYDENGKAKGSDIYLKLTNLTNESSGYNCYQQIVDKGFNFVKYDSKYNAETGKYEDCDVTLENLDDVESIIISVYHYAGRQADESDSKKTLATKKAYEATLQMSAFAYEGKPEVNEFVSPKPSANTENVSFTDWESYYLKAYADTPNTVKYYAKEDGSYTAKNYKTTQSGWTYLKETNIVTSKQLNVYYDLDRDQFNKAIVTANQENGTKKAKISVYCPKVVDTNGESMAVEVQIALFKYNGGNYIPIQEYIEPGKVKTFTFDVSELDVNSVNYIRVAFMAFWKYDSTTGKFYDTDTMKRYDKNGKLLEAIYDENSGKFLGYSADGGKTYVDTKNIAKYVAKCSDGRTDVDITTMVKNETLSMRTIKGFEAFVSPIYTVKKGETFQDQTVATTASQTIGTQDYEYAGYHFFDFKQEALNGYYGLYTHPSYVNFLSATSYLQNTLVDKSLKTDGQAQGFKDNNEKGVEIANDSQYNEIYKEASSLVSGGYQLEIKSTYPRIQCQHQANFFLSGADEDKERAENNENHKPLKAQGETYNYYNQMKSGLQYAKNHTNPEKRDYLAVDVYVLSSVHGYKNVYNTTYQNWCKKNKVELKNTSTRVEVQVCINAYNEELGSKASATSAKYVNVGEKTTLYIDVSELNIDEIESISLQPQAYENISNKEQGGDDSLIGITDVSVRFSAIYIPSSFDSGLTTTQNVTAPLKLKDAKKIKKLYDALPGLKVSDYNTVEDYNKLYALIKAWTDASLSTQEYCTKTWGIDYAQLSMLEAEVYEKIFGVSSDDNDELFPMGDVAFPMLAIVVLGLSGYVVVRTRKSKVK